MDFNSLISWIRQILYPVLSTPNSTVFIFSLALCLVLIVVTINRLTVDIKKLQAFDFEIKTHTHNLNEAKAKNDKTALRKLKRNELRLKQLRSYVSKQRLKASLITMVPVMVIYFLISNVYLGEQVALFPFDFPLFGNSAPFPIWYLLCYLAMFLPLSKFFGVSPS